MLRILSLSLALTIMATMLTPLQAAEFRVERGLRSDLDALHQVYGVEGWNNLGKARTGLIDSLSLTAERSDGTRYDPEPNAKLKIIHISGQTQKGDTEKLRKLLNDPTHGYRSVIVMEGPGGVFGEALRMGKLIHESIYFRQDDGLSAVIVRRGTKCLSACAVAAAWAGRALFVEEGARLGFHLPFFAGDQGDQKVAINQALDAAYDIAASYNELLIERMAHPDLFREAYKHRDANSFFYINGAYDAARYGFSGAARGRDAGPAHIEGVGSRLITKLCFQKFDLEQGRKTFVDSEYAVPYPNWGTGTLAQTIQATGARWFADSLDFAFANLHCRYGADDSNLLHLWMTRDPVTCTGANICTVSAPKSPSLVSNLEMQRAMQCVNGRYSGERERRVERDVNMRNRARLSGKVVTRLSAGQTVRILGCRATDDKQSVWYELSTGSAAGWASGRYFR